MSVGQRGANQHYRKASQKTLIPGSYNRIRHDLHSIKTMNFKFSEYTK
jgi:hypothetical protein